MHQYKAPNTFETIALPAAARFCQLSQAMFSQTSVMISVRHAPHTMRTFLMGVDFATPQWRVGRAS